MTGGPGSGKQPLSTGKHQTWSAEGVAERRGTRQAASRLHMTALRAFDRAIGRIFELTRRAEAVKAVDAARLLSWDDELTHQVTLDQV